MASYFLPVERRVSRSNSRACNEFIPLKRKEAQSKETAPTRRDQRGLPGGSGIAAEFSEWLPRPDPYVISSSSSVGVTSE